MKPTRSNAVKVARSFVGTPFHHQGRLPGVGLDCVGVIVCVARELGLPITDVTNYSGTPTGILEKLLENQLSLILPNVSHRPGDVVMFRIRERPQHVAILTSANTLVHAESSSAKVMETSYDDRWQKRTVCWWRLPGILED